MPELPEVEFARRKLEAWWVGRRVAAVDGVACRVFRPEPLESVRAALVGHRLESVRRKAKYLQLRFDDGTEAVSHLGMTGKWLRREEAAPARFAKLVVQLEGGGSVQYADPRMFGAFELLGRNGLATHAAVGKLGLDPLLEGMDASQLQGRLKGTKQPIKVALMDQARVAGLGNIQVAEALWRSHIHPARPTPSLTAEEWLALCTAIHDSLAFTLEAQGDADEIGYVEEGAPNPFLVYGRKGEPCPRCGTAIDSLVQAGRTSWLCPGCQRPPRK